MRFPCHKFMTLLRNELWKENCTLSRMTKKIGFNILPVLFFVGSIIFTGCQTNVKTIPLSIDVRGGTINNTPVPVKEVKIFRSTPLDPFLYKPIGMIVVSGGYANIELDYIYNEMRMEAAKRGAEYIVDFKIKMKKETVSTTNDDGETVDDDIYSFTATGTMMSRVSSRKLLTDHEFESN